MLGDRWIKVFPMLKLFWLENTEFKSNHCLRVWKLNILKIWLEQVKYACNTPKVPIRFR